MLVLVLGLGLVIYLSRGRGVDVAPGSTLIVEISGPYVEATNPTLLARVLGNTDQPFLSLLSLLALAERDDRIETVILHIRQSTMGWGKASELRAALARLRKAGRMTIAYLELNTTSINRAYYLATAAEKIYVVPGAVMPMVGLSADYVPDISTQTPTTAPVCAPTPPVSPGSRRWLHRTEPICRIHSWSALGLTAPCTASRSTGWARHAQSLRKFPAKRQASMRTAYTS